MNAQNGGFYATTANVSVMDMIYGWGQLKPPEIVMHEPDKKKRLLLLRRVT